MATLVEIFALTGGPDPNSPVVLDTAPTPSFLSNFSTAQYTGSNGNGPILNANAALIPTRADNYHDNSSANDYRLGNGLGVARAFTKPDSMAGQGAGGFQGNPYPNKLFGRTSTGHDLTYNRDDMTERAAMSFKKMGFKPNEVPTGAQLQPWQWLNHQALGEGSPIDPNQYNRNYALPDADAVARRIHTPAPSRLTKMLTTDVEVQALRPQRTLMHPLKVVTEDRQREALQRIPRNTDVIESVSYENIMPRGMGPGHNQEAPKIYGDPDVLRQPVGTNDTGSTAVFGRWNNPTNDTDPLAASTLEDRLQLYRDGSRYIRGQDPEREMRGFAEGQRRLDAQTVFDPMEIDPRAGEYAHRMSSHSGPLERYSSAGFVI
jgi:hypothetical protein